MNTKATGVLEFDPKKRRRWLDGQPLCDGDRVALQLADGRRVKGRFHELAGGVWFHGRQCSPGPFVTVEFAGEDELTVRVPAGGPWCARWPLDEGAR